MSKREKALQILKDYNGDNPYILSLKKTVFVDKKIAQFQDFNAEYVLTNYQNSPVSINKIVKLADWCSERKKIEWELDFLPEKIKIISLLGETKAYYHCYVQYRKSVPPEMSFIPRNGVITNFKTQDYTKLDLDFSWFDKKLRAINENYSVMDHQKEAIKFLLSRKKCILSLDQGLGKTMCAIIGSLMYGKKKVLIICPASIKTNWKNELSRFINEDEITIIKGANEMNKKEMVDFLGIDPKTAPNVPELRKMVTENGKWNDTKQYTIVNFDIIDEFHKNSRKKNDDGSLLLKSDFDIVIIDESHNLSKNTSIRYKVIKNYLNKSNNEYTWLLTGTMLTNNVKNLYNMLSLIENDITGDYQYFMERYCDAKKILKKGEWDRCWNMWNKGRYSSYSSLEKSSKKKFMEFVDRVGKHVMIDSGASNLDELNERIKHIYYRKMKEDIMTDVEKKIVPVVYKMTDEQWDRYYELWQEYEISKQNEGFDVSEMKDLLEVGVYRKYVSEIMMPNTIKLTEKLLSHDKKVFIVCCYDDEVYGLENYFGDKCVIFNGKMNQKQKDEAVRRFNDDENVKVFIGQIKACSTGINLHKSCNHAVFQNLDFTDSSFSQACDRIFRLGSKEDAFIYLQYFKGTVYENIVNIISRKRNIAEQIINNTN